MPQYSTPFGECILQRLPERKNESLQAWDSADSYLLQHLEENVSLSPNRDPKRVLIINDLFGALTIPLLIHLNDNQMAMECCYVISDSYVSEQAYIKNCDLNNIDVKNLNFINETQNYPCDIDLVLMKVPKSLRHLEHQLQRVKKSLKPSALVLAGDKTKNIHTSTVKLFEQIIGPTKTTLAWKKSRLITASNSADCFSGDASNPICKNEISTNSISQCSYHLKQWDLHLSSNSSVFSQRKLDQGTSFLLQNIEAPKAQETVIDLGCGNGVIGLVAKRLTPNIKLIFVDESYLAVESALMNYRSNFGSDRELESSRAAELEGDESINEEEFIVSDCLSVLIKRFSGLPCADSVFCNPPFHQQNVMGKQTAHRMINQSHQVLREGGQLWVVANRHLSYHVVMMRKFGHCEVVAGNKKFVVLKSIKQVS